jgi:hypothetical protein
MLATVSFDVVALGSSSLTLGVNALGDELGAPLPFETADGAVSVVSEPTAAFLFVVRMVVIGRLMWRRRAA